jgi:hypothetical protein
MDQRSRAVKHVKTAVLLLAWAPGHDDLGVTKEVRRRKHHIRCTIC